MRTRHAVLALVMVLAGFTATAEAQQGTRCSGQFDITISPGIGSEPSSGVFHSPDGENGTITCDGGAAGTAGVDGRYGTNGGDSCSSAGSGEGWGIQSLTLDGKNIKNTFTYEFGGLSGGIVNGTFDGEVFSGSFSYTPTEGDCVTAPTTAGNVRFEGVMKG
ncbi:MAG: hypothetical protein ACRDZ7_19970 [Acidimicrobiia bacterium]